MPHIIIIMSLYNFINGFFSVDYLFYVLINYKDYEEEKIKFHSVNLKNELF